MKVTKLHTKGTIEENQWYDQNPLFMARHRLGMALQYVANKLNITKACLYWWEIGDKHPKKDKWPIITYVLGVTKSDYDIWLQMNPNVALRPVIQQEIMEEPQKIETEILVLRPKRH